MGIKIASWQETLIVKLQELGYTVQPVVLEGFTLIDFKGYGTLVLNLMSVIQHEQPAEAIRIQKQYQELDIPLVHLWEDIWLTRPAQVLSRICAILGRNKKVHGRKTTIRAITQPEADCFLEQHHLQGSAKARYRYALEAEGVVVAVATFSGKRKMTRKHPDYTSIELIRFAAAEGITVQGGLSKLVKHLIKILAPNDVMTYADMDWSYGKGYTKLGFELDAQTPPAEIWLDEKSLIRYFPHRLPDEVKALGSSVSLEDLGTAMKFLQYTPVFNTGNLKYILYL